MVYLFIIIILLLSGCLTTKSIWEKVENDSNLKKKILNFETFKNEYLTNFESKGWIEKGRAKDKPEIKNSGFKVNVEKAYKNSYPFVFADLEPMPIMLRNDYLYYVLLNHKEKAYLNYPERYHSLLDDFNLRLTYHLEKLKDTDALDDFKYILNKPDKELFKDPNNTLLKTTQEEEDEEEEVGSDKIKEYQKFLKEIVLEDSKSKMKLKINESDEYDESLSPEERRKIKYNKFLDSVREKTNSIVNQH